MWKKNMQNNRISTTQKKETGWNFAKNNSEHISNRIATPWQPYLHGNTLALQQRVLHLRQAPEENIKICFIISCFEIKKFHKMPKATH